MGDTEEEGLGHPFATHAFLPRLRFLWRTAETAYREGASYTLAVIQISSMAADKRLDATSPLPSQPAVGA